MIERFVRRGSALPSGITLLQRFTLVGLLTTVAAGAVFGAVAVRLLEQYALDQHAHSAAVYVSEFLTPRLVASDFQAASPAHRVEFEFALRGLIGKAGVRRVAVWNVRGEPLYTKTTDIAGYTPPPPSLLKAALSGQVRLRIVALSPDARGNGRNAMEIFVPVVPQGARRPVAVYDILSDLSSLDTALSGLRLSVWASVIAGLLLLYVALFSIVRRASRELEEQQATLRSAFAGAVQSLVAAVTARDAATATHSDQVAELAVAIAQEVGLSEADVGNVRIAAFLHDVGKIGVADHILDKKGPLTKVERAIMQRHVLLGYQILQPVPVPEAVKQAVLHHHECWDGSGYPGRLAGEAIPVAARIIAVADTYGALTADRPYRTARDSAQAAAKIESLAGTQFDPGIIAAFRQVLQRWGNGRNGRPEVATPNGEARAK